MVEKDRSLIGDWKGTIYGISGDRWDWQLSLYRNGSYSRKLLSEKLPEKNVAEEGSWDANDSVLTLTPIEGEPSRWVIHDVTGCERANTLLVLRPLMLGSLRCRIHPLPGPPMPLDAHGLHES
jgi:hypothetical protein